MLQAMFNGVSAIESNQENMDVIGNNIANVNTTAYKSGRVTFEDQLSQTMQGASSGSTSVGGTNPVQVGLGVKVGAITVLQQQGGLQSTSKPTDMAIQGNGYFMVGNGAGVSYTRDGSFSLDNQGNLVNANGSYVLGWTAKTDGTVDTNRQITQASRLNVPVGNLQATAPTTQVTYNGNLDATATAGDTPYTRPVTVYDSQGGAHALTMSFAKSSTANTWDWSVADGGTPPDPALASLTPPTTTTAAGTANLNNTGNVTAIAVGSAGAGYTTPPTVTLSPPPANVQATATATLSGGTVSGGTVTNGGTGYTSPPTVTISGGGGTGAAATAIVNAAGVVTGFNITNAGTGYTSPPAFTLTAPPANAQATATASIDASGKVTGFTVTGAGSGYTTPPTVTLTAPPAAAPGTISFNPDGSFLKSTGSVGINYATAAGLTTPQQITPDFSGLSQVAASSSASASKQDGYAPGTLQSFSVDNTGTIAGIFTNGQTRTIGQIALTNFANPAGLQREGSNDFQATVNSGLPQVGAATSGSFGQISTGYLEQSNVDLSTEFTNMIITQNAYSANTKVVSTVNQMLSTLIDIIH